MYIIATNPYQGLQNAIRPGGSDTPGVDKREAPPAGRAGPAPMAVLKEQNPVHFDIGERINALVRNLDLTLVHFPPFFPIATYQRMDLIYEMKAIAADIPADDTRPEFAVAAQAGASLGPEADDAQIAEALAKLIAVRDTLARDRAGAGHEVRPGSLFELEI